MNSVYMHDIGTLSKSSVTGAGLACYDCRRINVTGSTFDNMYSEEGGIFYISETNENHLSTDSIGKYIIQSSYFNYGIANAGGAIFLDNP